MSKFLDRFRYFKQKGETFADGHGQLLKTNRDWEDGYRQRWQHDKVVRSTHGVNCTGSCSWKIYVKNGLITWECQQTDYPRTRWDMPNHEPRGCARGASCASRARSLSTATSRPRSCMSAASASVLPPAPATSRPNW